MYLFQYLYFNSCKCNNNIPLDVGIHKYIYVHYLRRTKFTTHLSELLILSWNDSLILHIARHVLKGTACPDYMLILDYQNYNYAWPVCIPIVYLRIPKTSSTRFRFIHVVLYFGWLAMLRGIN